MIVVDPGLAQPPYEQIRSQIAAARESGEMPPGHRLPTVRHLAAELGIAPNTVARAYRELEAAGLIETRGRHGSYVTGTEASATKVVTARARTLVAEARALGLDDGTIAAALSSALAD